MDTQSFLGSPLVANEGQPPGHLLHTDPERPVGVVQLHTHLKRPVQQRDTDTALDVGTGRGDGTHGLVC